MKVVLLLDVVIPSISAESIAAVRMADAMAELGHEVELVHALDADSRAPALESIRRYYGIRHDFPIHRIRRVKADDADRFWARAAVDYLTGAAVDRLFTRSLAVAYLASREGWPTVLECHRDIRPARRAAVSIRKKLKWYTRHLGLILRRARYLVSGDRERLEHTPNLLASWRLIRSNGFGAKGQLFASLLGSRYLVRIVVITSAIREALVENFDTFGIAIRKVADGAVLASADIRPVALAHANADLCVGYCGHLYRGKGMALIAAIARLCPTIPFHIVGGTDADRTYWREKLAGSKNIIFHGHVPPSDTAAYIAAFDICLLPNQAKVATHGNPQDDIGRFTSPLKMFEYMAAGKPIIASDLAVLREVLRDGHNALLCPPDDPRAWADVLERLNNDKAARDALGARARADLARNYTWTSRAEKVLERAPTRAVSDSKTALEAPPTR